MVARVVALDSGPLGLVSHPHPKDEALECWRWMQRLQGEGVRIIVPEVADYEIRRELPRAKKVRSLARLDFIPEIAEFLAITSPAMRRAADLWAQARNQGRPTAADVRLDWDVVLAAQVLTLDLSEPFAVATTNVAHLSRYVPAAEWRVIKSS